jgi:sugar phosphate isomerase/epimerase
MEFRIACADFTFPLLPHDKVLQLIALLEIRGVDIGLFEDRSHLWPSRELVDAEQSGRRLKDRMDALGLETADVFLQMATDFEVFAANHPDSDRRRHAREWFIRTLDYASAAGARHVTTLPGLAFASETYDASFARAAEELTWRAERAQEQGITFGIEAHVGSVVPDPESALELVESAPGLTLTLDYTHFTRLGIPDARVEPLIAHTSHFHVRGAREGRLQARFAENTIDYARVLHIMRDTGYSGWLGIEYVWMDWERCNECDNLSETILFRDSLRKLAQVPPP